ncbi:MAG: hypothetical protein HYU51_10595 [Candidatus Rokubacteria bacterium]|nr:hypothetical protein [Candidatus Rokubacteria bacterium]
MSTRSLHTCALAGLATALALVLAPGAPASWAWAARPLPVEVPLGERARLERVTEAATLATRYEARPFAARRDVFEYLLDHPEFATHVTRALKLARYRIWREPDGLWLDDGWGARGRFEVVHAAPGVRVMYARGEYEQRFLPNIAGEAVVVIEFTSRADEGGRAEITPAVSGFVRLDNPLLAAAGRFASSIVTAKAEKEAQRLVKVFARTSRAIEENPGRVCDLLRHRPDVPKQDLEEFRRLLNVPRAPSP